MWLACYTIQKGARKWQRYLVSMWGGVLQSGSSGNLTFSSNHRAYANVTFSKPFNNIPRVILSLTSPNYRNVSIDAGSITTSGFTAYIIDNAGTETTCSFDWIATDY